MYQVRIDGTIDWNRSVLTNCLLSQAFADSMTSMWLKTFSDGFFSEVLEIFSRINLYVYCANTLSHVHGTFGQKFLGDSKMVINPSMIPQVMLNKKKNSM